MTTDPRRLFQDSSVPEALRADLTSAMQHDSVGYDGVTSRFIAVIAAKPGGNPA